MDEWRLGKFATCAVCRAQYSLRQGNLDWMEQMIFSQRISAAFSS